MPSITIYVFIVALRGESASAEIVTMKSAGRSVWAARSGAFLIGTFARADPNSFAFNDEGRDLDDQPCLELGGLGDVRDAGALEAWLRFNDLQIHRGGQLDADGLPFVELDVDL